MGSEILAAFLIFPAIFWSADIIQIMKSRNVRKHVVLLCFGAAFLSLSALVSMFAGFPPLQGVIFGSAVYPLVYVTTWLAYSALSGYLRRP